MSIIGKTVKLAHFFTQTIDLRRPSLQILDRKVSDFSKTSLNNTMEKKKILSFEEFKQKKFDSLEDFIKEEQAEYPDISIEKIKKRHHNICSSMYRRYIRIQENPSNNPALMLQSDFFEDETNKS